MSLTVELTNDQIQAITGDNTPRRIMIQMSLAATHVARLKHVEEAIDWIAQEHTKTRQNRQDRNEDGLTTDIVTDLKSMGFDAAHDTQYGGHCDIIVEGRDEFLWIAEAKIHKDYDWLLKGFQQLDTRYSTGLVGQDAGEIIIYTYNQRADQMMESWVKHLGENRGDVTFEDAGPNPLLRRSTHVHEGTGATFKVRHKAITLYFKPQDIKGS